VSARPALLPADRSAAAHPRGRLGFGFGPRFFLLLLLGLALLGPAFWSVRFAYGMLAWDLLLVIAWGADLWNLPTPARLAAERRWEGALALHATQTVRLAVTAPPLSAGSTFLHVHAIDDLPPQLASPPPELHLVVPGGGTAEASYQFRPGERGDFTVGAVHLRYQSGLRLAERWARVPLVETVRVYPDFHSGAQQMLALLRGRRLAQRKRRSEPTARGRSLAYLREYRDGDEWRDVVWSASARRGRLISQVRDVERSQDVWLVLDCGRLQRARLAAGDKLDLAVDVAFRLAQVAVQLGDQVGVLSYGRTRLHCSGLGRDAGHLRHLLEDLALLHAEAAEADHLRAAATLLARQSRRALIVWLTDLAETAMTPEVVEAALHLARRHLVLFAVVRSTDLFEVALQRPATGDAMYRTTAALEVVQRREVLLAQLRQRGALTVEVDPGGMPAALVNRYLDIKRRHQL